MYFTKEQLEIMIQAIQYRALEHAKRIDALEYRFPLPSILQEIAEEEAKMRKDYERKEALEQLLTYRKRK